MTFIMLYVTHENMEEAQKVANYLLENKLIVCANYFPIQSSYWWNNKITNSNEIVSILKTRKDNWEKIKLKIEELHPYDVPCIIKLDVEANSSYESWIDSESQ